MATAWCQPHRSLVSKACHYTCVIGGVPNDQHVLVVWFAALAKQHSALRVDAEADHFVVEADGREVQRLTSTGLGQGVVPLALFGERGCTHPHDRARAGADALEPAGVLLTACSAGQRRLRCRLRAETFA